MAITVKEVRFRTYICFPLNINLQKDNKMSVCVRVCVCVCVVCDLCCGGGMPSFSSTLSFILSTFILSQTTLS